MKAIPVKEIFGGDFEVKLNPEQMRALALQLLNPKNLKGTELEVRFDKDGNPIVIPVIGGGGHE